jgi:hypothetical protein
MNGVNRHDTTLPRPVFPTGIFLVTYRANFHFLLESNQVFVSSYNVQFSSGDNLGLVREPHFEGNATHDHKSKLSQEYLGKSEVRQIFLMKKKEEYRKHVG